MTNCSIGAMAGSTCINSAFEARLGGIIGGDALFNLKKSRAWAEASIHFDRTIKPAFRGIGNESYLAHFPMAKLPDQPRSNLEDSCWELSG